LISRQRKPENPAINMPGVSGQAIIIAASFKTV
jgi:hypothetical protein